ncbi:MAG: flavodoxin family protein BilS [Candidatus Merdivicinus sp.]|jgi:flavodoxin I
MTPYAIVYTSRTGNTAKLAELAGQILPKQDCAFLGQPESNGCSDVPLILAGFWTDRGSCTPEMQEFLKSLHGKTIALFGTAGFGGDSAYFSQILSRVSSLIPADNRILPGFLCQGKMLPAVRKRYEAQLEQHPGDAQMLQMIANFDAASTHPDKADLEKFRQWVESIQQMIDGNSNRAESPLV